MIYLSTMFSFLRRSSSLENKKKTIQPCEMFPTSINDQIDISITPEDPAILTHPVNWELCINQTILILFTPCHLQVGNDSLVWALCNLQIMHQTYSQIVVKLERERCQNNVKVIPVGLGPLWERWCHRNASDCLTMTIQPLSSFRSASRVNTSNDEQWT